MMPKHFSVICAQDGSIAFASGYAVDHQLSYTLHLLLHHVKPYYLHTQSVDAKVT